MAFNKKQLGIDIVLTAKIHVNAKWPSMSLTQYTYRYR